MFFKNLQVEYAVTGEGKKKRFRIKSVLWECPGCGCLETEAVMKKQPARWIAENPEAYHDGKRSFWLNAFSSPWVSWAKIILQFLYAQEDPKKLQVVFNTLLGELWEERGDLDDEDTMLSRREEYRAELPDGVLVLTCGVDTQDNRLEYEILGHGHFGTTWGIRKGFIIGCPGHKGCRHGWTT
jgi:phage terminase large subunit GpA-like protein